MNDDLKKSPAIYRDFDELEQRVLAMGSATAFNTATTTGRNLTEVLVATGAAFGTATAEFTRIREALRRLSTEMECVLLLGKLHDGTVAEVYARAPNGVLTAQEMNDAFQRACVSEADVRTIAVEYHAPAAPGRRKVGGAQWKNERRGGFSRR